MSEIKQTAAARPGILGQRPLIVVANTTLAASEDYLAAQAALLALSRISQPLVASTSTHAVPMESPATIVEAIRRVVEAIRR
ncbi:MAG TPA: hypothetical protein VGL72_27015 [Bryobacteraceae bacterium]|jgi:hypothetical protein